MSSKRPGTVDYSKWDHFASSDSESDDDDDNGGNTYQPVRPPDSREEESYDSEDDSDYSSEDGSGEDDESESEDSENNAPAGRPLARRTVNSTTPAPTLAALQRAWNVDVTEVVRPCANCFSPDAPYSCSRCRLIRYCNTQCQVRYHPIHKLECIDAAKHNAYWGIFGGKKTSGSDEETDLAVLRARRSVKRRRALQRAAAAAAVERARNARVARGGVGAKGGGKGKGAEQREEECSICLCEFTVQGDGGVSFCCPSSHYMCFECSGCWVNSVMSDLDTSYPPKCPHCKALMSIDLFERQLSAQQQKTFRAHAARTALKPGEELIECKECGLFEVVSDDPVLWWCPHCECGSCRVCNKDLPQGAVKFDIAKSEHHVCARLRKPKALIEEAIEEGSKMRCPSCKLAGRKDEACTHMSCTKCSTEWCYVCGLSVVQCDKALPNEGGRVNDIYLHNRDWETNENRCPMYLTQILEIDLNWLGPNWEENARDEDFNDDERCLDYLHRFKTIKLLQAVREEVGDKAFIGAFVTFDSIENCGYTCNEVVSTDTDHLIDRSDFIQYHEEDEARGRGGEGGGGGGGGGGAFANALEQRQVEMALEATAPGRDEDGDEDDAVDPDELEQRLVTEAIERSARTAAEDDQLRAAMARSTDEGA